MQLQFHETDDQESLSPFPPRPSVPVIRPGMTDTRNIRRSETETPGEGDSDHVSPFPFGGVITVWESLVVLVSADQNQWVIPFPLFFCRGGSPGVRV